MMDTQKLDGEPIKQDELPEKCCTTRKHNLDKETYRKLHRTSTNINKANIEKIKQRYERSKSEPSLADLREFKKEESHNKELFEEFKNEYISVVTRSESEDSVDRIAKELNEFEMDKDRKKKSIKQFILGSLRKQKTPKEQNNLNAETENSNFNRNLSHRHTTAGLSRSNKNLVDQLEKLPENRKPVYQVPKEVEQKYAENHVNKYNKIRKSFEAGEVQKLTDEEVRDYLKGDTHIHTRIQHTNGSHKEEEKHYEKPSQPYLVRATVQPRNIVNSQFAPKSPSTSSSPTLMLSKLKIPSNRDSLDVRLRSPMSQDMSTDKYIATKLLTDSKHQSSPNLVSKENKIEIRRHEYSPNPQSPVIRSPRIHTPTKPPRPSVLRIQPEYSRIENLSSDKLDFSRSSVLRSPTTNNSQTFKSNGLMQTNSQSSLVELRNKRSPQKEDIKKSLEAYYFKEIKKLKDKEDQYLEQYHQIPAYYTDSQRSRSLSSSVQRDRRSLSMNRNYTPLPIPQTSYMNNMQRTQLREPIYGSISPYYNYDSDTSSIYQRGSGNEMYSPRQYNNKRVSFTSQNRNVQWPTRNGYVQTPPERREMLEDDVFLPPHQEPYKQFNEPVYATREHIYGQLRSDRELKLLRSHSVYNEYSRQNEILARQKMYNSYVQQQAQYANYMRQNVIPVGINQSNPINYENDRRETPNYRRVSVNNKECDIYGKIHVKKPIHNQNPSNCVIMGQLQSPVNKPFVRNSRLTASVNDMYKNVQRPVQYCNISYPEDYNGPTRPLPPKPSAKRIIFN